VANAHVLRLEALESIASCVAATPAKDCDADTQKEAYRKCMEATFERFEDVSHTKMSIYADAYCDRQRTCGDPNETRVDCVGRARADMMNEYKFKLYGPLSEAAELSILDCIRGAECDQRAAAASDEVLRCMKKFRGVD
jgi:hypothetical protein